MIPFKTAVKSFVAFYAVAIVSFGFGCGLGATKAPDPRASYLEAIEACRIYELAPSSVHTEDMDRICTGLRQVCGVALAVDVELGAGGEGGGP